MPQRIDSRHNILSKSLFQIFQYLSCSFNMSSSALKLLESAFVSHERTTTLHYIHDYRSGESTSSFSIVPSTKPALFLDWSTFIKLSPHEIIVSIVIERMCDKNQAWMIRWVQIIWRNIDNFVCSSIINNIALTCTCVCFRFLHILVISKGNAGFKALSDTMKEK